MKPVLIMALLGLGVFLYLKACVKAGPMEGFSQPVAKMEEGRKSAERKAEAADLTEYQSAVDRFKTTEERLPLSFQEMKDKGYIADIPGDLSYDPATGVVSKKSST